MGCLYPVPSHPLSINTSAYLLSCIDGVGDTAPHMVCWLTVLPLFVTVLVPEAGSDVLWCTSDPLGVYWQLAPLPSLYPYLLLSAIASFLVLSLDLMDTSVGGDGTTLCLGMSLLRTLTGVAFLAVNPHRSL